MIAIIIIDWLKRPWYDEIAQCLVPVNHHEKFKSLLRNPSSYVTLFRIIFSIFNDKSLSKYNIIVIIHLKPYHNKRIGIHLLYIIVMQTTVSLRVRNIMTCSIVLVKHILLRLLNIYFFHRYFISYAGYSI